MIHIVICTGDVPTPGKELYMTELEFIKLKADLIKRDKILVSVHYHKNSMLDFCFVASRYRRTKDLVETVRQNKVAEKLKNDVPRNYFGYLLSCEQKKFR